MGPEVDQTGCGITSEHTRTTEKAHIMISKALRLVRVFHGKNQSELAGQLEISRSYLCEIESGKKTPSMGILDRYAEVFEIPASSLLLFSEQISNPSKAENIRVKFAKKITILLDWIAETEKSQNGKNETAR